MSQKSTMVLRSYTRDVVLLDRLGPRLVVAPLEIRSIFPQELPLLVSLGGLRLIERFGAWSGQPFAADSPLESHLRGARLRARSSHPQLRQPADPPTEPSAEPLRHRLGKHRPFGQAIGAATRGPDPHPDRLLTQRCHTRTAHVGTLRVASSDGISNGHHGQRDAPAKPCPRARQNPRARRATCGGFPGRYPPGPQDRALHRGSSCEGRSASAALSSRSRACGCSAAASSCATAKTSVCKSKGVRRLPCGERRRRPIAGALSFRQ